MVVEFRMINQSADNYESGLPGSNAGYCLPTGCDYSNDSHVLPIKMSQSSSSQNQEENLSRKNH